MIWDARLVSDRVYHRRRFLISMGLVVLLIFMLGTRLSELPSRHLTIRDWSYLIWAILLPVYVRMAVKEYREMRNHG